jgi:hypothetical protein
MIQAAMWENAALVNGKNVRVACAHLSGGKHWWIVSTCPLDCLWGGVAAPLVVVTHPHLQRRRPIVLRGNFEVVNLSWTWLQDAGLRGSGGAAVDAQRMGCEARMSALCLTGAFSTAKKLWQRRQEQGRDQIPLTSRV